jgi:23S rRNA (guanosine2251-2'-O)-methyltransferase
MQITPSEEYLYGYHPVQEVMRAERRRMFELFLDEAVGAERFRPLLLEAQRLGIPSRFVSKQELFNRCESKQHQGVVLLAAPYPYLELDDSVFEQPRLLLLDNIEDPRNAGAILRSADIFGFQTVLFPLRGGSAVYPSVVKTSAGASEHLRIIRAANSNRYVQRAKEVGYRVLALDMKGTDLLSSVPVQDVRPLLLVIGGEDKRIGQFILNEADTIVRIPQIGHIGSLNASVAAGIALYHFGSK